MNQEYEIAWHGGLWRDFYAPKPAPPVLPDTAARANRRHVRIRRLLEVNAMTQKELAIATGMPKKTVSDILGVLQQRGLVQSVVCETTAVLRGRPERVYRAVTR